MQLENVIKHCMIQVYTALGLKPKYIAAPLASLMHDLAMEHGRDLHTHGENTSRVRWKHPVLTGSGVRDLHRFPGCH